MVRHPPVLCRLFCRRRVTNGMSGPWLSWSDAAVCLELGGKADLPAERPDFSV